MVGDNYKKIIPAGGADVTEYSFNIPSWTKGPVVASAVLRYRKFNNIYARWALKDKEVRLPIVDVARDSLTVPVRIKPEVYRVVRPSSQ